MGSSRSRKHVCIAISAKLHNSNALRGTGKLTYSVDGNSYNHAVGRNHNNILVVGDGENCGNVAVFLNLIVGNTLTATGLKSVVGDVASSSVAGFTNGKNYCVIVAGGHCYDLIVLAESDRTDTAGGTSHRTNVGFLKADSLTLLCSNKEGFFAIRQGNTGDSLQHIGTVLVNVMDRLDELSQSDEAYPGLTTGLRDLDKKINGLNKSDLILIAARPGMGKTSIALNIALAAAKKYDKTVAFFSLEMSREQLAMRLVSNESFVDNQKLVTGKLTEDEWGKIAVASAALSQTDLRVDDNPSISVAEMNAKCRRIDNLGLVLIDYLQLMTSAGHGQTSNNANRVQVVSDISRALKIMAKELNVPVICLSQLSRANESRTDKRPMLSDLRESGAIEQDADEVIFIYRDDYYNPNSAEKNVAEIIVAKNRHGEVGTVKVQWLPQFTTFADREWKHSEG